MARRDMDSASLTAADEQAEKQNPRASAARITATSRTQFGDAVVTAAKQKAPKGFKGGFKMKGAARGR